MKEAEKADFSQKIRILYAVSRSMKFTKKCFDGKTYDVLEQECFSQIQKEIASQTQLTGNSGYTIAKEQVKVNLPVRVNWGGEWELGKDVFERGGFMYMMSPGGHRWRTAIIFANNFELKKKNYEMTDIYGVIMDAVKGE